MTTEKSVILFAQAQRPFKGNFQIVRDFSRDEEIFLDEIAYSFSEDADAAEFMDTNSDGAEVWREEFITTTGRHVYLYYCFTGDAVPRDPETGERVQDDSLLPFYDSCYIISAEYTDDERENIPAKIAAGLHIAERFDVSIAPYEDAENIGVIITNCFKYNAEQAAAEIKTHDYAVDLSEYSNSRTIAFYL
ncbi:MAG: hypothetical protein RR091_10840 [Cloacibacillus sp.]